jgi:hypothetical protein
MKIGFVNASLDILNWIKIQIDNQFPLCQSGYRTSILSFPKKNKNGKYYEYVIEGLRAVVIFDHLRKLPIPKLARKWNNPELIAMVEEYKQKYPHFSISKLSLWVQ